MGFWRRLVAAAVVAANVVGAMCHGYLQQPRARNVVHNSNYCPHCLNAGGPWVTYAGGRAWPRSRHGACGDPVDGPRDHEAGGRFASRRVTGSYREGQVVVLKVRITAAHNGRFSFGVCPLPPDVSNAQERRLVTQGCFDAHPLRDPRSKSRYWWLGKRPAGVYAVRLRLPRGVRCRRCVLQWHYESGNSCLIPGTPARMAQDPRMVPCDRTGVMEEFWNCADVRIR